VQVRQRAQEDFERFRRSALHAATTMSLPLPAHHRTSATGTTRPGAASATLRNARPDSLISVFAAAQVVPGDGWVVGERVSTSPRRDEMPRRRSRPRVPAARGGACAGFAYHSEPERVGGRVRHGARRVPDATCCRWRAYHCCSTIIPAAYRHTACAERTASKSASGGLPTPVLGAWECSAQ
jgi:hypothetical protein